MTDTIRKRREARARYDAALASWRASSAGICPGCHDAGTILHEEGELPCPMCNPAGARAAARGATP